MPLADKEDEGETRRCSRSYIDGFFPKSDAVRQMSAKFAVGGYSDRLLDLDLSLFGVFVLAIENRLMADQADAFR